MAAISREGLLALAELFQPLRQRGNMRKDIEAWIYFDGPEPDHIRPLLDGLRDARLTPEEKEQRARRLAERHEEVTTSTPEEKERVIRRLIETYGAEPPKGTEPPDA
jgi:hypothetical protein